MKLTIWGILFIFWIVVSVFIFTSCIPKIPEQTIEVVNECTLLEPFPKPELPTVEYITVGEFKCFADSEQEQNAVKREVYKNEYCNNMLDLYNDARKRCSENKGE